ncbi:restriction endonuclease subunit S [Enterococcus casseliflavus]|uniref:restriction endonuclease subunit S n=1 Tax=Enterococcus casseliflavus TaxID=37734 RepID=UPI00201C40FD|nr:restriction endonuclease subunit S [Enterococcus casseliflavus]
MSNDTRPEIRFPGFTDDWEERKLGDVSNYSNGGSYESDVENRGKYELITLKSVDMFGNLVSSGKFINKKVPTLNKGTLVMILSEQSPGLLGMTAQIPKDDTFVLNQRVAEIHPNDDTNGYFLSMAINRSQAYFSKRGAGTKVQNISKSNVENFEFFIPIKHEQQKIGTFFKNLDDTITLHQRKLDLLKETKKGFLQKMFPKNGAKVPEIRFPGFTENWEEKKFKEVINSGIKGKAKAEMSGTKSLYLDTNYLNGGVVTYVDSPRDVENDDVLILWDGSQAGTVYYGFSGALGSTLKAYRAKESGAFLYQQLKRNQQIIYDRYRTPNIPHVVKTFTDEFMVSMPSSEEQFKIGTFFKPLDDTIALQQRKLDLLKETKKGFLQKMFV